MTNPIVGAWELVSCEHRVSDGTTHHPLGADAKGQLIYTPDGHMSVLLMRADRAPFGAPGLFEGSVEERAEAVSGFVAYSGRYELHGAKVVHHIELSLFPNWTGTSQERLFRFEKEQLVLQTASFVMEKKEQVALLIWRKV